MGRNGRCVIGDLRGGNGDEGSFGVGRHFGWILEVGLDPKERPSPRKSNKSNKSNKLPQ